MRYLLLSITFLFLTLTKINAQSNFEKEQYKYRKSLNKTFKSKKKSPLAYADISKFKGLDFFEADKKYKVTAVFKKSEKPVTFKMKTSTSRLPSYVKYGTVQFVIDDNTYILNVYQGVASKTSKKYKNHLFLPFTDLTNGIETYTGGRYIDLFIPESNSIIIDFNKAYNPYCAYSNRYSCPIPPTENNLDTRIEAGVKAYTPKY